MPAHGINVHKADPGQCMVSDCTKRGIYRKSAHVKRGYCLQHKHYASRDADRFEQQALIRPSRKWNDIYK